MAVEFEGLEFQIETQSEEAVKGVTALSESLGKLRQATKGGLGLNSSAKQLSKLNEALKGFQSDKLESLGKALHGLEAAGKTTISPTVPKRIGEIAASLRSMNWSDIEKLEALGTALRDIKDVGNVQIPTVNTPTVSPAASTPVTGEAPGAAVSDIGSAASQVQEVTDAVRQATGETNILKRVLGGIGGVFKKGFSVGAGALKKLGSVMRSAGSAAKSLAAKAVTLQKNLGSQLAAKVKQTTAGLGQMFSSLKRIAMYRAIRAALSAITKAFKDGINNLYQYSNLMGGTFAQSMDSVATNALYLKNSLGAMAAPIINALAPAIDFITDKIVNLLNMVNMLIARLTGSSTYTAAKKVSTAYAEAADDAAGAAKKAADKIKSYTVGIDELNIIQENPDDKSGGGGGGGTDYGSMFEELPIAQNISDFADRIKELFNAGDWKGLGTLLGEKVNEAIDSVDWSGIGHKLGYYINGAVQTAYWFLDTVDFVNIGRRLAELLNGALEEIDFTYVGRLIVKWFTLLPDMIIGFLVELDWGLVGKSISDCLIGAFDEATKWLNSHDWSNLGATLWQKIKDLVTNIDWGGIATSLFTALGTAIRSAAQFLGGFFGSIGADIKKWWDEEIKGTDWKDTAGNLLSAIGQGFLNIGGWVMENIVDPFCNALLGENVWSGIKDAGREIWNGLCAGITEFFADPGAWIKKNIVDPFVKWFKDLFGIHSPSTVMAEIGKFITEGLLEGILKPFKAIGTWVNNNILQPLKKAFEDSPLIEFAVGVANTAKEWWGNVKNWWAGVSKEGLSLSALVSLVKSGWTKVKTWIGEIPIISQGISLLKSGWNTVKEWVGNIPTLNQAISLLKSGWTTVKNWIGNIPILSQAISLIKSGWTTVKNWIGNIPTLSQAISLLKSGWTTVKNWIGTIPVLSQGISLIKSGWTTVKNWIGNIPVISQAIDLIKSGWTTVKGWIGNIPTISQGISLIKSGWTSIKDWIGTNVVSVGISLFKSGWSSLSSWIGNTVSVGISLFKDGWSSIKSFFGLSSGGIIGANGGVKAFSSGGVIKNGAAEFWNSIPKYAGGTTNAHGSMFVAGEAGAELVGHVNGRTEVLNKSQLGQVMHRSIVDGMAQFAGYWKSINTFMATCSNAIISAILVSADTLNQGMATPEGYTVQDMNGWMDKVGKRVSVELAEAGMADQIVGGVRDGVYEATARQNDLLREQNDLLQRLVNKDTTVQIGNKTIRDAVVTQENADGYRFTK